MTRRHGRAALALALLAMTGPALGSGGPPPRPGYVFADPQDDAERAALGQGRIGIVKGATTDALLYLDWRILNGLSVGAPAATALARPCCDTPGEGGAKWIVARRQVPAARQDIYYVPTERRGPNYTSIPNCFDDAFVSATATLSDRIARFSAGSRAVQAWLATQDAVFETCGKPGVALPALPVDAPPWLRADRAYQEAAFALYDGRPEEAARRFAAIARDPASPWRGRALYLEARALHRAALAAPTPARYAAAHAAIARLAAAPAGSYGQSEIAHMRQVLDYREHPAQLLARLDADLARREAIPEIAVAFRDYMTLADKATVKPEAADWIRTVQAKSRETGLAHARERWRATGRVAWLVAALGLADPTDAVAAELANDAGRIAPDQPAWLTAQYHLVRLSMDKADPAATRMRVEHILARPGLSRSDRNIFTAARAQLATSLSDFARFALRSPYCAPGNVTCVDAIWRAGDGLTGRRDGAFVGFGAEARAIIDRLPLADRVALAADPAIPRDLRLDLALTSYARAVQLQDHRTIDRLAAMLATLLPQLAPDWRRIAALPPGADKRFAEFFVMAKIPSIRVDLTTYARPQGTVAQFSGYWVDWLLVAPRSPPPPRAFAAATEYLPDDYGDDGPDTAEQGATRDRADLTCLMKCGLGAFPLRMPGFAAAQMPQARAERRYLVNGARSPAAGTTISIWDEMLAYVRARPADPRAPEALYRLVRVARWGGDHDRLGQRAFLLLHSRYPASTWTRRSPFWYGEHR